MSSTSLRSLVVLVGVVGCRPATTVTEVAQNPAFLCTDAAQVRPTSLAHSPPPVSGGTLLVTHDGRNAIAADPDRDLVHIVDVPGVFLRGSIALEPGDEPGRVVEDQAGLVHVALRSGGAVVSIDPRSMRILRRRAVCGSPRGIAYQRKNDLLYVACASGELISLPAGAERAPIRQLFVEPDLRDVIAMPDGQLLVSRFRSAELLTLDESGALVNRRAPAPFQSALVRANQPFSPSVAWRTVPFQGGALMLHQRGMDTPVLTRSLTIGGTTGGGPTSAPPSERPGVAGPGPIGGGSSYGGSGSSRGIESGGSAECSSAIVHSTLSWFVPGTPVVAGGIMEGAVVPVDVAVSPDGNQVTLVSAAEGQVSSLFVMSTAGMQTGRDCLFPDAISGNAPLIAAAYAGNDKLLLQAREPARLFFFQSAFFVPLAELPLSVQSRGNTGHELFHKNSGGNVACASCHPEGGDDGRVWQFDLGARRTQNLRGGLLGSEPFHWTGDEAGMMSLVNDVFTHRMGGAAQSCAQIGALASWVDTIPRIGMPALAGGGAQAARGRNLFFDPNVACASCHTPPLYTNNGTFDVGTGAPFQVPRLVGVGSRGPWLHDGCAKSLRDRFGACGGGDLHGHTSHLSSSDIDDLLAFLNTL